MKSNNKLVNTILILVLLLTTSGLYAQKFSMLPEKERNEKLIEIAKSIFKHPRFKNSYREYGSPRITVMYIDEKKINSDPAEIGYGKDLGSLVYVVTFPYDKSKEIMEWYDFAAEVLISDKQMKAYMITFGSGMGCNVWDIDKWGPDKKW